MTREGEVSAPGSQCSQTLYASIKSLASDGDCRAGKRDADRREVRKTRSSGTSDISNIQRRNTDVGSAKSSGRACGFKKTRGEKAVAMVVGDVS